jgi:serine/threonine protein kinase
MQVISQIGRGGFGTVELVQDEDGSRFALKTFCINQPGHFSIDMVANVKKRFIREANIQSEIDHYNIVPVIEKGVDKDPPYYLMPLALSSLDMEIQKSRNLNGHFLEALMDILAGLEEIHSLGIYHRDLKPQNVLMLGTKDNYRYAISDFGLMSINDTKLSVITHTGMSKGSDFYTAPEIVRDLRNASARSDIYSVGCILHDFVGTEERIPCNEITDDQSLYADIIRLCTRKDPARRFQTISDLREALISIERNEVTPSSQEAVNFIELLDSDSHIDRETWLKIINYVEDHYETSDVNLLFSRIRNSKIVELINLDTSLSIKLCIKYADWAKNGVFPFSSCDGIANRLETFYQLNDLSCKAEILLAFLFLGTSHNRWYVERKFMAFTDANMQDDLARRLALELRVFGKKACVAFNHLEFSIDANLQKLHPILVDTINKICPN